MKGLTAAQPLVAYARRQDERSIMLHEALNSQRRPPHCRLKHPVWAQALVCAAA